MVYNHTSQPPPPSRPSRSLSPLPYALPSPLFSSPPLFLLPFLDHSPVSTRFQFPVNSSGSPSRDRLLLLLPSLFFTVLGNFSKRSTLLALSASHFVTSSLSRLASLRPTLASIYFPASSTFLEILWIVRTASLLAGTISFVLSNFSDICLSAFSPPPFFSPLFPPPNNFPFTPFCFSFPSIYFLIYRSSARVHSTT